MSKKSQTKINLNEVSATFVEGEQQFPTICSTLSASASFDYQKPNDSRWAVLSVAVGDGFAIP